MHTINSRFDLFALLHVVWSTEIWHIPCCMRLAYSGGRMNYCIESFALLFKMIMEQADVQQGSAVSWSSLLLRKFPLFKFVNGCLQWWRWILLSPPGCLNGLHISGKVKSPFLTVPELICSPLLSQSYICCVEISWGNGLGSA